MSEQVLYGSVPDSPFPPIKSLSLVGQTLLPSESLAHETTRVWLRREFGVFPLCLIPFGLIPFGLTKCEKVPFGLTLCTINTCAIKQDVSVSLG